MGRVVWMEILWIVVCGEGSVGLGRLCCRPGFGRWDGLCGWKVYLVRELCGWVGLLAELCGWAIIVHNIYLLYVIS